MASTLIICMCIVHVLMFYMPYHYISGSPNITDTNLEVCTVIMLMTIVVHIHTSGAYKHYLFNLLWVIIWCCCR